ncbi:MAG: methyl-accepting chemotaxis protein [Lachnospiraceae bacterium]|nr:methyl-accepting chemotaxis protein [Lachnospiraceae bacterium]MDD6193009.1 methyl-accepting chemotaxis protein [Lachnospiraceae bacterium]MDY4792736.1 methyl-accepting chemotaxis protein [Pararoseburia sp.]
MSAKKTSRTKKAKVNIHSVRGRMFMLTTGSILLTVLIMCAVILPTVKSSMVERTNNNLLDLAIAYGSDLEGAMNTKKASGETLRVEEMASHVEKAYIKGCDTSYCYVVDAFTGNVIYDPVEMNIGQKCNNDMMKKLLAQIEDNIEPQPSIASYKEQGVEKYAAYYYSMSNRFVLVVCVEESDFMSSINSVINRGVVAGVILVLIGMVTAFLVSSKTSKPLLEIVDEIETIASLDLRKNERLTVLAKNKDESGQIARAIREMRIALVDIVSQIQEQSAQLFGASDNLNENVEHTAENVGGVETAVNEIATGANNQASETMRANEGVVAMGNMIEDTNAQVTTLNTTAEMMRQSNEIASQAMRELDRINKQAIESIGIIYEQTNTTNASAKKISEATTLISSIADETNLLSLNATIEAARAGEAGRGFAVVATQIQKLAEQSNESAKRIDEIIKQLVNDSESAVRTMDDVQVIMQKQSENLAKTAEVFAQVKDGIGESINGMGQIASVTGSLNEARNEIIGTVQSLTAIAEQNAASTQETSASVVEINEVLHSITESANRLKDIAAVMDSNMNKFRI